MSSSQASVLLLALGNDLLGDDGAALAVARQLKEQFRKQNIDIVETSEAGLSLMEIMTGYKKVLLIDSVQTGKHPPGSILEFEIEDFSKVVAPSPHYAGIPEVLEMAKRLKIPFPEVVRIFAIEVVNPFEFKEEFSPEVQKSLPQLTDKVKSVLDNWLES